MKMLRPVTFLPYTSEYRYMKNVFFKPYVGKKYNKKGFNGVKVLALGDSHYCSKKCSDCGQTSRENCSDLTIDVVHNYLNFKKVEEESADWMKTFTKFSNVFVGGKLDNDAIIEFWESIAFYNYVQSSVDKSRVAPSNQQYEDSESAFNQVLRELNPDIIIVWGKRLWEQLPDIGEYGAERKINNAIDNLYYYQVGSKEIPAFCIYHPSSSYLKYEDSKKIKQAINLASQ